MGIFLLTRNAKNIRFFHSKWENSFFLKERTYFDKIHSHNLNNVDVLKFVIVAECIPVLSSMIGVRTHLHLKRKQPPDKPGVGGWRMRAPSGQQQQ